MLKGLDIANYFIDKSKQSGERYAVTNMKVQKLLYYTQSLHLAMYNESLFEEELQAWVYGPVCPPVYQEYKVFGSNTISQPALTIVDFNTDIENLLQEVWQYFGRYHAYLLSDMTHDEQPWLKARKGLPSDAPSIESIDKEDMKQLGKDKLLQIEIEHPAYTPVISRILEDTLDDINNQHIMTANEFRNWLAAL
ncbi:MAG: SocA family protein [Oscillatoriales cyanobacterium SM2_2_1]|nr:SocA family protein [Oscillatoriales cyanobacterium SM2_2_1]